MKTNTSGRRNGLQFSLTAQHLVDSAFIAWSAASPDSSHEFWVQPCELCHRWGVEKKLPAPITNPPPYHCLFCIPHAKKSLCPQASTMSYLCGPAGIHCPHNFVWTWWMMAEIYRCQIFVVFISPRHTHPGLFGTGDCIFYVLWIALPLLGEVFFIYLFIFFILWPGVILPFYGVCITASLSLSPQLERLPAQ